MNKKKVLELLKMYKDINAAKYGIDDLGIFGSLARNEEKKDSDIDVVIKMKRPNLFLLSKIRIELEEKFQTHVDIVSYCEKMNPFLKKEPVNNFV